MAIKDFEHSAFEIEKENRSLKYEIELNSFFHIYLKQFFLVQVLIYQVYNNLPLENRSLKYEIELKDNEIGSLKKELSTKDKTISKLQTEKEKLKQELQARFGI